MRIAVVSETSAADKNEHILGALADRGHEIINAGMKDKGSQPELTYIHTGFIGAVFLSLKIVDLVVGGCGTGQGFLNSVLQYPGVVCGHILDPLDAWLFTQINGGNCISLALNQGYGWAGDVTLRFIFDRLFAVEPGAGYPSHRRDSQRESRLLLQRISKTSHRSMPEIVAGLPAEVVRPALSYPGVWETIQSHQAGDQDLKNALSRRMMRS